MCKQEELDATSGSERSNATLTTTKDLKLPRQPSECKPKTGSRVSIKKCHLSLAGKATKHQMALILADQRRNATKLEKWWIKMTTPKVKKPKKEKPVIKRKGPWKPVRVYSEQKLKRDKERLNSFKRSTSWVARSEEEYNEMHNIV